MLEGKMPAVKNPLAKAAPKPRVLKTVKTVLDVSNSTLDNKVITKRKTPSKKVKVQKEKKKEATAIFANKATRADYTKLVTTVPESVISAPTTEQMKKAEFTAMLFSNTANKQGAKFTRLAGVGFAIIGILCTLLSLQTPGTIFNKAEVLQSINVYSNTDSITTDCTDPLLYSSPACRTHVDQTPAALFIISETDNLLEGLQRIQVSVAYATKIRIDVYAISTKKLIGLGLMSNSGGDVWDYNWDTRKYPDGEYQFRAIIENVHGSYEQSDTNKFVIENLKPTATIALGDAIGNSDDMTDIPVENTNSPVLTLIPGTIAGEFRFEISAPEASSVKLYAKQSSSNADKFVGSAYKGVVPGTWKYRWQPATAIAGSYDVSAYAFSVTDSTVSNSVSVTIVSTVDTTDTTTTVTSASTTGVKVLQPPVTFTLSKPLPLAGVVNITLDISYASSAQVYVRGNASLVKKYLGKAVPVDIDTWLLQFDSTQLPDGAYTIVVDVKNQFGTYEAIKNLVTIKNTSPTTLSPEQTDRIKTLASVATEVASNTDFFIPPESNTNTVSTSSNPGLNMGSALKFSEVTSAVKIAINPELERLAVAMRMNDAVQVAVIKQRLLNIKAQTVGKLGVKLSPEQSDELDTLIAEIVAYTEKRSEAVEKIITERTNEKANEDSDKDGVSNYDEVVIYTSNPFNADTDNDGFTDGAEILSGYDPLDAKTEALVVYESPKDTGIVRDDIFTITSISTAQPNEVAPTTLATATPVALIAGKAPINSFVTLYIFSTPTVVTIKTETDGSWNYRFDKELEDGEHQIYVAVTDNAGKIIAKSKPFNFIKKAEAFTSTSDVGSSAIVPAVVVEGDMLSDYSVYSVLTISVLAIALLLLLLGLHLDTLPRIKPDNISSE